MLEEIMGTVRSQSKEDMICWGIIVAVLFIFAVYGMGLLTGTLIANLVSMSR